jgi:hypothetical protein
MAYIHECDICGKRFPNDVVLNVVSFFEAIEERYETRGLYQEEFRRIPAGLNAADPCYELCDECFELARNTIEGMRATADVLRKAAIYKEAIDFERGEND